MIIALAQFNPVVSDLKGNGDRIAEQIVEASRAGARVVVFSELCLPGYPPKDLMQKAGFVRENRERLNDVARACGPRTTALIGFAEANPNMPGRPVFNALARCQGGRVVGVYHKRLLPTYDVFDESRYFEPGQQAEPVELEADGATVRTGITICEDLWNDADLVPRPLYHANPVAAYAAQGVRLIINSSASPFVIHKQAYRERLFGGQAAKHRIPIVVVNQVGGNDELVFDGASCAFDSSGRLAARARAFDEDLLFVELDEHGAMCGRVEPYPDSIASVHDALVLGTRDYLRKCGFRSAVLGLSGGIDSAVVACLAVAAIGREAVHGVAMPSRVSSEHSVADARTLAHNLGIRFDVVSIEDMHAATERTLADVFAGCQPDVTEENIQARLRAVILMAISNKFGRLLLTTGNKSELGVGYCTLYGDMCGGLALISDVPKTMVYELARYINARAGAELIPRRTIEKPPSAELRPNQVDQDSLPPYDLLDAILNKYVEDDLTPEEIIAAGFDARVVRDVVRMVERNEYKRRQAAPGIKVTSRAFGFGRRMPIAKGQ